MQGAEGGLVRKVRIVDGQQQWAFVGRGAEQFGKCSSHLSCVARLHSGCRGGDSRHDGSQDGELAGRRASHSRRSGQTASCQRAQRAPWSVEVALERPGHHRYPSLKGKTGGTFRQ